MYTLSHLPFFFLPKIIGRQCPAPHTHPNLDGIEKSHQCISGTHCRQGICSQKTPHNQSIRHIIQLLQKIAQYHGPGEPQHGSGHISLCQIFFHFSVPSFSFYVRTVFVTTKDRVYLSYTLSRNFIIDFPN